MTPSIVKLLKSARRISTPLVAFATPDPGATVTAVCELLNGEAPKVEWDTIRGMRARNESAKTFIDKIVEDVGGIDPTRGNPIALLEFVEQLPESGVVFVHLAHRWIESHEMGPQFVQALWNSRDECKATGKMVVLLGPSFTLPAEIGGDVLLIDEPLPDADELRGIVRHNVELFSEFLEGAVGEDVVEKAVEAVQGLPNFQADQTVAMSFGKNGLDVGGLWEEKRKKIQQTPGLKCFRGDVGFGSIGGVQNVKGFIGRILRGNAKPNAIVFVDEIEKMMGGSRGDTSGVSQDQLGTILSYMQDEECAGMIFVGPPGTSKSMVAKAAGVEGGIPTVQLDLGACKGSLVGESERQLRQALKVVTSVSNGRSLWIATCNSLHEMPPELRRRFKLGTFFFDLPSKEERRVIWGIYTKKYGLPEIAENGPGFDDEGWTGAEISQACEVAWRLDCALEEAAGYVVPVAKSAADRIEGLRQHADGKFLSASEAGVYKWGGGRQVVKGNGASKQRRLKNPD